MCTCEVGNNISLFHRWGNRGSERLGSSLKVTQQINRELSIYRQSLNTQNLYTAVSSLAKSHISLSFFSCKMGIIMPVGKLHRQHALGLWKALSHSGYGGMAIISSSCLPFSSTDPESIKRPNLSHSLWLSCLIYNEGKNPQPYLPWNIALCVKLIITRTCLWQLSELRVLILILECHQLAL